MKHLVFVYGTLKSGHVRQGFLSNQRYIGIAKTKPDYVMLQYGSYPAIVSCESVAQSGVKIFGELYEVGDACLIELDELERVSQGLFYKSEIKLDSISLSNLPVSEFVWHKIEEKVATAYFFVDSSKLMGAKECGSIWAEK